MSLAGDLLRASKKATPKKAPKRKKAVKRKGPDPMSGPTVARVTHQRKVQQRSSLAVDIKRVNKQHKIKVDTKPILTKSVQHRKPIVMPHFTPWGSKHDAAQRGFDQALKHNHPTRAGLDAPVQAALNETLRPIRAIAGGVDAAVTHKNVGKAIGKGLLHNKGPLFGDVLKHAGAGKGVQNTLGLALDIGLDPTTYITGGAAGVQRAGARLETVAGKDAAAKAVAAGASKKTARKIVKTSSERGTAKGLTLKVGGHELPGVRTATAHTVGRAAQKITHTKPGRSVSEAVKSAARDVNPNIAPKSVPKETWDHATSAARTARARTTKGLQEAQRRGLAVRRAIGKDDHKVIHAIETNTIHTLPSHLQVPAKHLASEYRAVREAEKAHGIKGATREHYVPHYTKKSLEEGAPSETRAAVGRRVINPDSSQGRIREGTLSEKIVAHPGEYNEDAALAYVNRISEGHRSVTQAKLNHRLADLGRKVEPGKRIELTKDEGVFRQHGSDLTEITDKQMLGRVASGKAPEGRYVVLHRDVVKHAHAISSPGGARSAIGVGYDKVTGGFKFIATQPNPAFHARNFIGDVHNAYLGQPAYKLPGHLVQSGKALLALGRDEKAQRELGKTAKPVKGTVTIDGKKVSYHELAQEAADVGAIRSGFTARELYDLLNVEAKGAKHVRKTRLGQKATAAGQNVKRAMQAREDNPRLATYIAARKRGLGPEAASRAVAKQHFDYANLTEFERKYARRALPFYTFSARDIPLQITTLLTKPGKYANYAKLQAEAAQAAGLPANWQDGLSDYQKRNAPIPVKWKGKTLILSVGGLPLTDLNEFPTTLDPTRLMAEWLQRGASMVNPIIKDPAEIWANYSTFFRDQIRKTNQPLVNAPAFVAGFPDDLKRKLHVVKRVDKRTGKTVWKWDAMADYVAHATAPGLGTMLMGLTAGPDAQSRSMGNKLSGFTGIKSAPYDPTTTKINQAYKRMDDITGELGYLQKRGVDATDDRKRDKLNAEHRKLMGNVVTLARKRGDKVLPGAKTKKARKTSVDLGGSLDLNNLDLSGGNAGGDSLDLNNLDLGN